MTKRQHVLTIEAISYLLIVAGLLLATETWVGSLLVGLGGILLLGNTRNLVALSQKKETKR